MINKLKIFESDYSNNKLRCWLEELYNVWDYYEMFKCDIFKLLGVSFVSLLGSSYVAIMIVFSLVALHYYFKNRHKREIKEFQEKSLDDFINRRGLWRKF